MKQQTSKIALTAMALALSSSVYAGSGCGYNKTGFQTAALQSAGYHNPAMFQRVGHHADAAQVDSKMSADIVDVAASAGSFNTLVTAVKAAGLVETLKGEGPFTVFAPTDAAFAKLPKGTLEALLADKDKLIQILTYHVVPGKLNATSVVASSELATVEGSNLKVSDIKIAKTDVMASNGVIHVIDEVLIPNS